MAEQASDSKPDSEDEGFSRRDLLQGATAGLATSLAGLVLPAWGKDAPETAEPSTEAPAPQEQENAGNESIDPTHIYIPVKVPDPITIVKEPVKDSDIPLELVYVESVDGMYAPVGIRRPAIQGRLPFIVFCHMNGGMGTRWIREWTQWGSWTLEQFLKEGYAVAWLRYRAEIGSVPPYGEFLVEGKREGRQLFNRSPLGYDDAIALIEWVKRLPYVDPDRVGYIGLSHGGEMLMKITREYHGLRCGIASEPASAGFLGIRPGYVADAGPETKKVYTPEMLTADVKKLRASLDVAVTNERIRPINTPIRVQGRDRDHNQATFRLNYELLKEAGKDVVWQTYDGDEHGFIFPRRNRQGEYDPDPVQLQVVKDSIAYMNKHMKQI